MELKPSQGGTPTTMRRGYIFTLESMGIFAAWMMLLFFAWQHAGDTMNTIKSEQIIQARERIAAETLDALIQHHSNQPWKGCAQFSEEKKREQPYMVEKKCLEKLKTTMLPTKITRLMLHTPTGSHKLAGGESTNHCTILRRPILLDQTTPSVLEVSVCE